MDELPDTELERVLKLVAAARDAAALQQAAAAIQSLARALVGSVPAQDLTRLISSLNDTLTRRVIDLCAASPAVGAARWCWIALGSEGRQEQTFMSDQDNGIVFDDPRPEGQVRQALLPLALRINQLLDACGFPLCQGQVMASNPQWCLSLREWRERFRGWLDESDPRALLNATIFFDLRPAYGDFGLAGALRDWLASNAPDNPRFLFQMAENALRREPPLGLLRDFVVARTGQFAGTIDLKLQGAALFVDAARVFGLASGGRSSNTADRLRHAAAAQLLDADEADQWVRAFYAIQSLRLANQRRGAAMPNRVDPGNLAPGARRLLLDALHQARAMQTKLEQVYLDGGQGII